MGVEEYLLPSEFHEQINAAASGEELHHLARTIQSAWQRRHPDLVAVCAQVYYVPTGAASRLYRRDPARYRLLQVAALGRVTTKGFWRRVASGARDAFTAGDWCLLGWLAFHADAAHACLVDRDMETRESDAHDSYALREDSDLGAEQVLRAFHSAFNPDANAAIQQYLTAALSYFHCLPKGFAIPEELVVCSEQSNKRGKDASGDALTWSLLRRFWTQHRGAWKHWPETIDAIRRSPNPFLPLLSEQLRHCDAPLPRGKTHSQAASNPFAPLFGKHGLADGTEKAAPLETAASISPPSAQAPPLVQAAPSGWNELPEEMFTDTGPVRPKPRRTLGQRVFGWLRRMVGW